MPLLLALLIPALVAIIAHSGSLADGLFFDDYWHRAQFAERGWSFEDLIESATFDLPGRLVELWWLETPLQWRYARPLSMAVQKSEWVFADALFPSNPAFGTHVVGLLWHTLATMLVFALARWALRDNLFAALAAAIFALQPHSFFAISWLAARNALVGGLLLFAAVYCYLRASIHRDQAAPAPIRARWLAAALTAWLASLFTRETAIIFPALALGFDFAHANWRQLRARWWVYALLATLAIAYLYWRLIIFPTSRPPEIYYTTPEGPTYLLWAASKLLQMLFALVFQTPMLLGIATFDGDISQQLGAHAAMLALLALVAWWILATSRSLRARWIWLAWIVLAFLPLIPVFLMPHFAYLPAAALAVLLAAAVRGSRAHWRWVAASVVIAGSCWSLFAYRHLYRGVVRSEQLVYADIANNTAQPPPADSHLFFINLPVAGIYAPVALREVWNEPNLTGHVLTFAPHPLMMRQPTRITQLSEHAFRIETDAPGWFSGLSGSMLRDGMRTSSPLHTGERIESESFTTFVEAGDDQGITSLRFEFPRPLTDPGYRFYLSSPVRPAEQLTFPLPAANWSPTTNTSPERRATTKRFNDRFADALAARARFFWIQNLGTSLIKSDLLLTGDNEQTQAPPPTP